MVNDDEQTFGWIPEDCEIKWLMELCTIGIIETVDSADVFHATK